MWTIFIISVATFLGTMEATVDEDLNEYECPPEYDRLWPDGPCIAPYIGHRTTWEAANYFCSSISGELIVIEDVNFFMNLVNYLEEEGIHTDYWIGGRKVQNRTWTSIDDTAMPMGVPFWTVWPYNCFFDECDLTLAPNHSSLKECVAMSSDYFYYFNNDYCFKQMKPLCVFTGTKRNDWEDTAEFESSPGWRGDTQ